MILLSVLLLHPEPRKVGEMDFSLKGCQKVAGGRSAAQTTGKKRIVVRTLEGCKNSFQARCPRFWHPFRVLNSFAWSPVVCATLRPPATF